MSADPPDSPHEEPDIPTRDCPECGCPAVYDRKRNAWVCDDGCDGYIEDEDEDVDDDGPQDDRWLSMVRAVVPPFPFLGKSRRSRR